ncbi:hypothetical protein EVAR_18082_1 [Eumeta japonica]|uniref:Uncharacterized protein n=1 Tax=Eumeta variegata TaxID=151549 RepID=A0A4C1VHS8_EUMVA|nr:hypothetical protein EVAR_18082_1 [Eumeta japonica]
MAAGPRPVVSIDRYSQRISRVSVRMEQWANCVFERRNPDEDRNRNEIGIKDGAGTETDRRNDTGVTVDSAILRDSQKVKKPAKCEPTDIHTASGGIAIEGSVDSKNSNRRS